MKIAHFVATVMIGAGLITTNSGVVEAVDLNSNSESPWSSPWTKCRTDGFAYYYYLE